jgi:hypothetical protein
MQLCWARRRRHLPDPLVVSAGKAKCGVRRHWLSATRAALVERSDGLSAPFTGLGSPGSPMRTGGTLTLKPLALV